MCDGKHKGLSEKERGDAPTRDHRKRTCTLAEATLSTSESVGKDVDQDNPHTHVEHLCNLTPSTSTLSINNLPEYVLVRVLSMLSTYKPAQNVFRLWSNITRKGEQDIWKMRWLMG